MQRSAGSPASRYANQQQQQTQYHHVIKQFRTYSHLADDGLFNLSQSSRVRQGLQLEGTYGSIGSLVVGSQGYNFGSIGQGHEDARTIIQKLMNTRKDVNLAGSYRHNSQRQAEEGTAALILQGSNNSVMPLEWTQNRIFNEVISLIDQIEELKGTIRNVIQEKDKLEVERDHMVKVQANKKKGGRNAHEVQAVVQALNRKDLQIAKRYNEEEPQHQVRLTYVQLQKIVQQNQELQRIIKQIQLRQQGNIEELLLQERQRFRDLERKFHDKKMQLRRLDKDPEEIIRLKQRILKLTEQCHKIQEVAQNNQLDQEIERLKDDNQILRKRTIQVLQTTKEQYYNRQIAAQRKRLQDYIRSEQQSKTQFLEDLRKFKQQFNKVKQENKRLKQLIKDKGLQKVEIENIGKNVQNIQEKQQKNKSQRVNASNNQLSRTFIQNKGVPQENNQSKSKISITIDNQVANRSKYEQLTSKMKRIMG